MADKVPDFTRFVTKTNRARCPKCGAPELMDNDHLFIRRLKVFDDEGAWSQCLVCAGFYNPLNFGVNPPAEFNKAKGWFCERG